MSWNKSTTLQTPRRGTSSTLTTKVWGHETAITGPKVNFYVSDCTSFKCTQGLVNQQRTNSLPKHKGPPNELIGTYWKRSYYNIIISTLYYFTTPDTDKSTHIWLRTVERSNVNQRHSPIVFQAKSLQEYSMLMCHDKNKNRNFSSSLFFLKARWFFSSVTKITNQNKNMVLLKCEEILPTWGGNVLK